MLQPKVYIKKLNVVREVGMIDFYNKQVLTYVMGVRARSNKVIYSFEDVEFMENTGMKDKNGKYIYVGDIVKFDDEFPTWDYEGEISACDGFNVAIVTKEKNFITLTNFQADDGGLEEMLYTRDLIISELNFEDFEVIGNRYENEELVQ